MPIFPTLTNAQQHYAEVPYTEFQTNQTKHVESTNVNSCLHTSTLWLSLCESSQNSLSFNKFVWTSPVPDFIEVDKTRRKYGQSSIHALTQQVPFNVLISTKFTLAL